MLLANALTPPFTDAGTSAALATTEPSPAFSVETVGWLPEPHRVRKPRPAGGTTVALSEKPPAVTGIPQLDAGTTNSRAAEAASCGPPKGPVGERVSAMR